MRKSEQRELLLDVQMLRFLMSLMKVPRSPDPMEKRVGD